MTCPTDTPAFELEPGATARQRFLAPDGEPAVRALGEHLFEPVHLVLQAIGVRSLRLGDRDTDGVAGGGLGEEVDQVLATFVEV